MQFLSIYIMRYDRSRWKYNIPSIIRLQPLCNGKKTFAENDCNLINFRRYVCYRKWSSWGGGSVVTFSTSTGRSISPELMKAVRKMLETATRNTPTRTRFVTNSAGRCCAARLMLNLHFGDVNYVVQRTRMNEWMLTFSSSNSSSIIRDLNLCSSTNNHIPSFDDQ